MTTNAIDKRLSFEHLLTKRGLTLVDWCRDNNVCSNLEFSLKLSDLGAKATTATLGQVKLLFSPEASVNVVEAPTLVVIDEPEQRIVLDNETEEEDVVDQPSTTIVKIKSQKKTKQHTGSEPDFTENSLT